MAWHIDDCVESRIRSFDVVLQAKGEPEFRRWADVQMKKGLAIINKDSLQDNTSYRVKLVVVYEDGGLAASKGRTFKNESKYIFTFCS